MTILPFSPELSHIVISYATGYLHCLTFRLSIPERDLDTKKTTPNMEVCPEILVAMLEYWYMERGILLFAT